MSPAHDWTAAHGRRHLWWRRFSGADGGILLRLACQHARTTTPSGGLAAVAILVGHFFYLSILTFAPAIAEWLPTLPPPTFQHPYVPPPWDWAEALRQLLPWNLPAIGALIQVTIAGFMLRWARWQPAVTTEKQGDARKPWSGQAADANWLARADGPCRGARRVVCPIMGRRGTAGQSIGGQSARPFGLAQAEARSLRPTVRGPVRYAPGYWSRVWAVASMSPPIRRKTLPTATSCCCSIRRIRGPRRSKIGYGISFAVAGRCSWSPRRSISQEDWISHYNELLSPTAIRIREDVAISETGNWQHACQSFAHPATTAINPRDGSLFSDAGASLQIRWPARPLVVGRWGWSDPGSDAVLSGVYRCEAGERLGDLVLAAEQPYGQGTVVVLGGGFSLTNEGLVRGYDWAGRLLSYLASKGGSPVATWRQAVSLLLCLALLAALCRHNDPRCLMETAVMLAVALAMLVPAADR